MSTYLTETTELEYSEHTREIRYMFISHIAIVFLSVLLLLYLVLNARTVEEKAVLLLTLVIIVLITRETLYEPLGGYREEDSL